MKAFLYIALMGCTLLATGCHTPRVTSSDHVSVRDSVVVTNTTHVDTFKLAVDDFSGWLPLESLKSLGEATYRGDRTTTKIFYRDGQIGFNTISDSIQNLVLSRLEKLEKYHGKVQTRTVTKIVTPPPNRWIMILGLLAGLGFVIYHGFKAYKHFKP